MTDEVGIALQNGTAAANTNGVWNSFSATAADASLTFWDGRASSWKFSGEDYSGFSPGAPSAGSGDAAWVDEQVVAGECWTTGNASADLWRTLTVGVDAGATYTVKCFAWRGTTGRDTGFRVNGGAEQIVTANDLTEAAIFTGVSPDANNDLVIEYIERNTNNFGYPAAIFVTKETSVPIITDVDTDESVAPGQSYVIQATDDIGATQGTVFWERLDGTDSVQHTVTGWDAATDQITVTAVQGNHKFGAGLYRVRVVLGDGTTEIIFDNAGAGLSIEAGANGGYVDVVDPATNNTSSAAYQVEDAGGNPVVTGDQFEWRYTGTISSATFGADTVPTSLDVEGTLEGRFWDATDSTWGAWETLTFSDSVSPSITSVDVPAAGTYVGGQTLAFTVNWDEPVDVTGTPAINFTIGGKARQANYASGTGTATLVFSYTVQAGDEGAVSVGTLTLDGGTITDGAGNDANLTLNSVGDTSGVLVDGGPNDLVVLGQETVRAFSATIPFTYPGTDVTGFEYSLNGGAWTATSSPLELANLTALTEYTVEIRPVNGSGPGLPSTLTFTTNASIDATPDAFSFVEQTGAARGITVTSNSITVTGVDAGIDIPVTVAGDLGSEYSVSTDGGATWGGWTSAATNVRLNYRIRVRHTTSSEYSSGGYDGVRETTLTVGGVSATFTSTTLADTVPPVISLTGGNVSIVEGSPWVEPGYEAIDNADGDISVGGVVITGSVDTSTPGEYILTYTATDASGNSASTTRRVTVTEFVPEDTEEPVITLSGGNRTLTEGDTWVDPGYSATDNMDGDLTAEVTITGTVNTATPGSYTLTYSVTDAAGNTGTATRTVTVLPAVDYPFNVNAPARRTITASRYVAFQSSEEVKLMQSGEVLDYDFDLTDWLALEGDQIAEGTHEASELADSLEIVASGTVTGTDRIKVWLRADQVKDSESSLVQMKVTTTSYRTAVFQFRVLVINRMQ